MAVGYPRVFVPPIAFLADRDRPGPAVQPVSVGVAQPDVRRETVPAQPVRVAYTHVHSLSLVASSVVSQTNRVAPLPFLRGFTAFVIYNPCPCKRRILLSHIFRCARGRLN